MAKRFQKEEEILDIIDLYTKQGWTIKQIEQKYRSGHGLVSKVLHEHGITPTQRRKNRTLNEDYFQSIDTPEKAYFLGLLLADGNVSEATNRQSCVRLELVEQDKAIMEKFREELNSNGSLTYNKRENRENGTFTFSVRSNKIANDLSKFNIVPNKTYNTTQIIYPNNFIIDFIRGFIDGDGSIYFSTGAWHINICGHYKENIKSISDKINEIVGLKSHKIQVSDNVYRYTWNGKEAKAVIATFYPQDSTCVLARKQEKARLALEDKNTKDIV